MSTEAKSTEIQSKEQPNQDQSILDDASTLLMFSKSNKSQNLPPPHLLPSTTLMPPDKESQNTSPDNHINNKKTEIGGTENIKGEIDLRLSHIEDSANKKDNENTDSILTTSQNHSTLNPAAVAAAAALATAATIPLPLKRHNTDELNSTDNDDANKSPLKSDNMESENSKDSISLHKQWPVPESYIVDPDSGIITCICEYEEDDGFTIQCDHCYRWQHAVCYGIENINKVPEQYLCNACQPRKLDIKAAKLSQKRQRESIQNKTMESIRNNKNKRRKRSETSESPIQNVNTNESQSDRHSKTTNQKETERIIPASIIPDIRQQEHLLHPKDAYPAVYLPIEESRYQDRYVELFINKHKNDDYVIPYNHSQFKSIPVEVKPYSESNNSRLFPGFMKLGVFVNEHCFKNDFITEVVGELDFQKKYLLDPRNHYRIWGTPKRKVIFHPHWPITIDQRSCGNFTRFLRRSCYPNVQLSTIRLSGGSTKFVLQALKDIKEGEELHIDWQWDLRHPILQIINGANTYESFDDNIKYSLIHSIDTILSNCDCACGNTSKDCHLLKIKKISQTLFRSVKSKMNNRYKLNKILNQYQSNRRKREQPILNRLTDEVNKRKGGDISELHSEILHLTYNDDTESDAVKYSNTNDHNINYIGEQETTNEKIIRSKIPLVLSLVQRNKNKASETKGKKQLDKLLSKYDESVIYDMNKLPIPLDLPVEKTSNVSESEGMNDNDLEKSKDQNVGALGQNVVEDFNKHIGSTGSHTAAAELSQVTEQSTGKNLINAHSKKKLSFADYRKMLQK